MILWLNHIVDIRRMSGKAPEKPMLARVVAPCLFALALATVINSPISVSAQNVPNSNVPNSGGAVEAIGKVATVVGPATIEHSAEAIVQANVSDGVLPAKAGDFVYRGDTVQTATDAKISLIFTDGTAFNLDSNARMVLNEFVYDPKSTSNSTFFSLAKGSFTFVAGRVAKTGNMRFDTPVATMGIRGTTPHVEVLGDGSVRFSTLVEEERPPSPGVPGNTPSKASNTRPENDAFQRQLKLDLNICRGC
jgi:hypothetical protein